jgi:mono/diheme cytochrome c family protein
MRSLRAVSLVSLLLLPPLGCDMPTPLSPAEPIGAFPNWGQGFATPAEQPQSALGTGLPANHPGGSGPGAPPPGTQMPGAVADFSGGDAALGKGVFQALCARCHGGAGEGGAMPGNVAVPPLSDAAWQERHTDAQMARTIALGKGAMPAFMSELDRDKLAAVIAYVRTLKK